MNLVSNRFVGSGLLVAVKRNRFLKVVCETGFKPVCEKRFVSCSKTKPVSESSLCGF